MPELTPELTPVYWCGRPADVAPAAPIQHVRSAAVSAALLLQNRQSAVLGSSSFVAVAWQQRC